MAFKAVGKTLCFLLVLLAVTCPDVTSGAPASYKKANTSPVCFGAKGDQYGSFSLPRSGKMAGVKLVHLYGYVTCHKQNAENWSPLGCGYGVKIKTVITDASDKILLPPSQFETQQGGKWYSVPGFDSLSRVLNLKVFRDPIMVEKGQELRLWYFEDLVTYTEGDNDGITCVDVFVLYV